MKYLVTKKVIMTMVIEAETKQDAVEAFDETKATTDGEIVAKKITR